MRTIPAFILLVFMVIPALSQAQTMPEVVEKGLALAKSEGHLGPTVEYWSGPDNLDLEPDDKVRRKKLRWAQIYEDRFGKIREVEVLAVDQPIPENIILYSVLKYERGAVYLLTICYYDGSDWNLTRYQFCDHPAHILPDNLYDDPPSTEGQ